MLLSSGMPTTAESGNPSFWIAGRAGVKATALEAGHVVTWGRIALQFVRSPIASPPLGGRRSELQPSMPQPANLGSGIPDTPTSRAKR